MNKLIFPILILVVVGGLVFFFHKDTSRSVSENTKIQIQENFGKIPLYFEKNEGQAGDEIDFISRGQGYGFYIKPTENFFQISDDLLKMKLKGANEKANGSGLEEQKAKINYFTGNDPSKWKTGISTYAKVKYDQVYPGIDLVYYGNQKKLEYDFVVAPQSDYQQVTLQFEGAKKIAINEKGDLVLTITEGKELVQEKPKIYQEIDQEKKTIDGSYVLKGKDEVGFVVAAYDSTKPLVIDPTLEFSTYLGGSGDDYATAVTVDPTGGIIVVGHTRSSNFPTMNAYQLAHANNLGSGGNTTNRDDAFISKFSADGQMLVFSTYLGGNGYDYVYDVAVDPTGDIIVAGMATSSNFPTMNAYQSSSGGDGDAFVSKFSADGQMLIFSTYLGGSTWEYASGVTVDLSGGIIVVGKTNSSDLPTVNAYQGANGGGYDVFVSKFSADGLALVFSTYLGGSGGDVPSDVAVDSTENIILTGNTLSSDFPTVNPYQGTYAGDDVFVSKFSADGLALVFSTYLGGSDHDVASGVTVNSAGDIILAGYTSSSDFPTVNAYQVANAGGIYNAFVSKFSADGLALVFSTYLGGSSNDFGYGIAVDSSGNAYVTGNTSSTDFPMVNPYQNCSDDAFVSKLSDNGQTLLFSTCLGGNLHDAAAGVAVDPNGDIIVTGNTLSSDFPTVNAYQANAGYQDAFVAKFLDIMPPEVCDTLDNDGDGQIDEGFDVDADGFTSCGGDCDDTNASINPDATETCDRVDNDCDGSIDEGFIWFGKNCGEIKAMTPEMLHRMKKRYMKENAK